MTWTRADHASRLEDGPFDVLVIGGGIIGAGAALDAAGRGLHVALVEQDDFAAGTSSRSTKLLHGGLRYLPHFQFGLVREGLLEQKVLAETADFLYHPLEFLVPLYRDRRIADLPRWASLPSIAPYTMRAGLLLYDTLGRRPPGSHRKLSARKVMRAVPHLRKEGLRTGFSYWDAQTDDARLVISVVKTAVLRYQAVAVNGASATGVQPDGDGLVTTVLLDGSEVAVRSTAVVAATGAFNPPAPNAVPLVYSSGAHLVFDRGAIGISDQALMLPETSDGRVIFVVPWEGKALVGTTDRPFEADPCHPPVEQQDVDYLLTHLSSYLEFEGEPISAFTGLRSLIDEGESTADTSREHLVKQLQPGLVQVAGGKLTTYRRIAAEAVDSVLRSVGIRTKSRTARELLVGAGIDLDEDDYLARRYGAEAASVLALAGEEPEVLSDGVTLAAEATYTAGHEAVSDIADFALRRTHLAWFSHSHGREDAAQVGRLLGAELGWSASRIKTEVRRFEEALAAQGL